MSLAMEGTCQGNFILRVIPVGRCPLFIFWNTLGNSSRSAARLLPEYPALLLHRWFPCAPAYVGVCRRTSRNKTPPPLFSFCEFAVGPPARDLGVGQPS